MTTLRRDSAENSHKIIKSIIYLFIIAMVITVIAWGFFILQNPEKFPFRTISVVITKNNHVDPAVIKKVVSQNIHGGFFSLRVNQLRQALLQIPWIYDVSLRRVWPDQLIIDVQEQQAVARWGNDTLLNVHGELFKPSLNSIPNNLPLLTGPTDSQQEMLQTWQQLDQMLSPLSLRITAISLNPRHAWQLTINGHMQVMLGREAIQQRMTHFVDLYPKVIANRQDEVERIDLRYPNGVAIQWKAKVTDKVMPSMH
jgi:cell division protein FtsQ